MLSWKEFYIVITVIKEIVSFEFHKHQLDCRIINKYWTSKLLTATAYFFWHSNLDLYICVPKTEYATFASEQFAQIFRNKIAYMTFLHDWRLLKQIVALILISIDITGIIAEFRYQDCSFHNFLAKRNNRISLVYCY